LLLLALAHSPTGRRSFVLLTGGALLFALAGPGCRSRADKALTITVTSHESLPGLIGLRITASQKEREVVSASFPAIADSVPLTFPVVLTLRTSGLGQGDTVVEARAFDASRTEVARGAASVTLSRTSFVAIELVCESLACAVNPDAGASAPDAIADGRPAETPSGCGNGILDVDETCDTAIPPELPGACPQSCDDAIPCTEDTMLGSTCTVACVHTEIVDRVSNDGCCPAGATRATDPDCSASCGDGHVDPGESCDLGIRDGAGACPTVGTCDDSARCTHTAITIAAPNDACCPVGADARMDADCPAACGNGILEPGEQCDTGIAGASRRGVCPTATTCSDGDPCTTDIIVGSGCQASCQHLAITVPAPGDGCCPTGDGGAGPGTNVDPDCSAVCGNGVLEAGETCDKAIAEGAPGSCPNECPAPPQACLTYRAIGARESCSVSCVAEPVLGCSAAADGCCPKGCEAASDPDCPATCGDGILDPGEQCDVAIADGPGSCARSCSDGVPCTDDILIDAGSCTARCSFVPTTTIRSGDGCCPPGAHAGIDSDCAAICGNGVVEVPWETCDTATSSPSCAPSCPGGDSCSPFVTLPSTSACSFPCLRQPITTCASGDGCCPSGAGCTAANDSDCGPQCGNGLVDVTETCDLAISAGHVGACPASCADDDPCTLDFASGTRESCDRVCSHAAITTCGGGDRCCPAGCTPETDADCASQCGDAVVQAGETCDPPSTCPASCADDGDACTLDQLLGSASACNAVCAHTPILRCSGTVRDGCCPSGCARASDADC
jgi:hypothetical protein